MLTYPRGAPDADTAPAGSGEDNGSVPGLSVASAAAPPVLSGSASASRAVSPALPGSADSPAAASTSGRVASGLGRKPQVGSGSISNSYHNLIKTWMGGLWLSSARITEKIIRFFLPCTIQRFLLPSSFPPSLPSSQLRVISTSNQLLAEDDLPIHGYERCCRTDYLFVPSLPGEWVWGGGEAARTDCRLFVPS